MNSDIMIAGKAIQNDNKPFLIAEVAQAHDGSLGMAHAFVSAAAVAGADAIKFQTHIASAESTRDEPFRVLFSKQDATRYDYWRRMEFTPEQWQGLAEHARECGLVFLSSPFSVAAVLLLDQLGTPAWKIGSGELRSTDMMQAILATGKPILLSTGMASYTELDQLTAGFRCAGSPFAMFQCTSKYPSCLEEVGLNVLQKFRKRYACPVGLSDHTGRTEPAMAAMAQGAAMVEVHVTFHRGMFGPDVPASLTFEEFATLAAFRDALEVMRTHPVDKDALAHSLADSRRIFGKSVAPVRDLPTGTVLDLSMLTLKKPATGIPPEHLDSLQGRRLRRNITADRLLQWSDLDDNNA